METITYADWAHMASIKISAARRSQVKAEPKRRKIALSESAFLPVDTGSQMGDPNAAVKRRLAEIDGAFERGTVKVPRKGDKGRTKLTEVPATEDNVREALAYWETRKPRTAESRAKQTEMVALLRRRLTGILDGPESMEAPEAGAAVGQRDHGSIDGVALVRGRSMKPVQPQRGWAAKSGTNYGPLGREQMDSELAPKKDKGRFTPTQRRAWRRKQERLRAQADK